MVFPVLTYINNIRRTGVYATFFSRSIIYFSNFSCSIVAVWSLNTVKTRSTPRISTVFCFRQISYIRRRIRLRTTADLCTFLLTTTAARYGLSLRCKYFRLIIGPRTVLPCWYTPFSALCPWNRWSRLIICIGYRV